MLKVNKIVTQEQCVKSVKVNNKDTRTRPNFIPVYSQLLRYHFDLWVFLYQITHIPQGIWSPVFGASWNYVTWCRNKSEEF